MAITIGDMLGGIGAAFGGTTQQYAQGLRQREQGITEQKRAELQARQQAMYQDAGAAFQLLQQGDLDGIISLADDRLELLNTFPDADPSDTMRIRDNAIAARQGDPIALRDLATELTGAASAGRAMGILQAPEVIQPEGVVVNGNLVDKRTGDILYQSPPAAEAGFESSPGITRYRNGVAVQYSRTGQRQVIDELGNIVSGEAARDAIQRGVESGVTEQGEMAAATAGGRATSERAQAIINAGVDALPQFRTLTTAIGLLGDVKTGGFESVSTRARSLFGIESGDEGELSNLLATNVLQQLKPIFGSAFTAAEGERLERISASISRSTETNMRLLGEALQIARTAAEKALDRAQEAGDFSTAREIQNALRDLDQFDMTSSGSMGTGDANPDLLNRADAIVGGGV
jgi:hypothetical protein